MLSAEDEEWCGRALVAFEQRSCASKVLTSESWLPLPQGANYLSDIIKLRMDVETAGGQKETRTVIYKTEPATKDKLPLDLAQRHFMTEVGTYRENLVEMEKLIKEMEPGSELLWPRFYGMNETSPPGYLMEDLSASGFVVKNARQELDWDHSVLAIRSLARFHAAAAVVREKGLLNEKHCIPNHAFFFDPYLQKRFAKVIEDSFTLGIREGWPEEWHYLIEPLSRASETVYAKICRLLSSKDYSFLTLCHGDFWANNIMFRHDAFGNPTSVRFLDFQMTYIHSPILDLYQFIYTSLKFKLTSRNQELLHIYHESLEAHLRLFGYDPDRIPSLETLSRDMERLKPYGQAMCLVFKPYFLNPPYSEIARSLGLDDMYDDQLKRFGMGYRYRGEYFLSVMRQMLAEMTRDGFFEK